MWPAILAIADNRPVSGRDALASFALGFEVETRVAHAAGQTHYDAGWHVTGTSGHVGAAAAAARTMGLDRDQIEHAMAAGATQAAGLRIMAGSDLKSMHPGKAAMDGVLAATLVEHRLTASAKALEGDFGYLAVMSAAPAPEKISAGLGETWNLTSNGHKLYPSGSLTHPMIDGVIVLVTENDVAPGDVTVIDVRVSPPAARFTDLPRPATPMQAKFSLRHCAAAAVVFRRVGTDELSAEVLARPDVIDLRDRVKVVTDPAIGKQDADVEITLASGRTLSTEVRGNRGTPSAPLDDDELGMKFRELVGPGARRGARRPAAGHLLARRRASRCLGAAGADCAASRPMADVALVTGAGSGLGAVIAERLAREGLTVAVNTRAHTEEADAVAAAIRAGGGSAFAVTANVTDPSAVRRMFETIADRGTLRVLVNNASYRPRQRIQTITEDDWHQVRSVTLDGAFRCIRCALPTLIPGGRIVNILGRNALAGDPERVHLSAAKHGLLGLTLALAAALRDDGVAVNGVSPGVDTEGPELDRCRAEIASQVARLAFADAAELTGTVVRVDCDGSVVTTPTAW